MVINLSKGGHSLNYSGSFNSQNRQTPTTELASFSNNLTYQYTRGQDSFGLELLSEQKDQDPGNVNRSYKAGLFWTHAFQKSIEPGAREIKKPAEEAILAPNRPAEGQMVDLAELEPGSSLSSVRKRLDKAGITAPLEQPNILIYEASLIGEIEQRQRLALLHKDGNLTKAALLIDFTDIGRPESLIQTFERIRSLLIEKYGRPTNFYEKGDPNKDLINQVKSGTFIRLTEWSRPGGETIRFGIPRRLDGIVRMELQIADSFPPPQDTLWSIEGVI